MMMMMMMRRRKQHLLWPTTIILHRRSSSGGECHPCLLVNHTPGECIHFSSVVIYHESADALGFVPHGHDINIMCSRLKTRRSYIVDVARISAGNALQAKPSRQKVIHSNAWKSMVASSSQCRSSVDKIINERQPTATTTSQVDVIYVNAHNAKGAKIVLESLSFLDKRYKMVKAKAEFDDRDDELIAIPVTESCIDQLSADNTREDDCTSRLKRLIVRRGTETVPFSSSSMGKMKQKRWFCIVEFQHRRGNRAKPFFAFWSWFSGDSIWTGSGPPSRFSLNLIPSLDGTGNEFFTSKDSCALRLFFQV